MESLTKTLGNYFKGTLLVQSLPLACPTLSNLGCVHGSHLLSHMCFFFTKFESVPVVYPVTNRSRLLILQHQALSASLLKAVASLSHLPPLPVL